MVFDSQNFSKDSLRAQAEPSANPPEVDPYSDEAIEEDDPFGDDAENISDLRRILLRMKKKKLNPCPILLRGGTTGRFMDSMITFTNT